MPRQSDDPDHPSTLPQADLNPLLNPTLSRNMGRWAEVYFTSDPEKRDEAVLQLLHELENETPQAADVAPPQFRRPSGPSTAKSPVPAIARDASHRVTCFWCGYINRPQYKFCGRCGEPLAGVDAGLDGEQRSPRDIAAEQSNLEKSAFYSQQSAPSETMHSFPRGRAERAFSAARDDASMPSILTTYSERSFRPWFAAVLAVVVLALAYVSWRGAPTKSAPPTTVQTPPAVAAPEPTQQQTATPDAQQMASSVNSQPETTSTLSAKTTPAAIPPNQVSAPPNEISSQVIPPTKNAPAGTITGKGFEELAQARDFLNGTNGREHNTSIAAQWLWKAVRKQNADATVLLSELYLRGDGVPKSCDQARLLLDAAALKGRKDAAGELQNLTAFGCQ